jgi:AcrR family transcriptional regulator
MTGKQDAIFNATLELVSERGFHDAPTSLIAQEAGVGVGTIYRYFENKEDLIDELYKKLTLQLARAMLADYSADLPLRERFRRIWINTARYHIDHPLETAFIEQYANSPFLKPETANIHAEYSRPVFEFIENGVYEGVLKDLSPELFASLTLEVAISLTKKHREGAIVLDGDVLEQAVDACWDAIKR